MYCPVGVNVSSSSWWSMSSWCMFIVHSRWIFSCVWWQVCPRTFNCVWRRVSYWAFGHVWWLTFLSQSWALIIGVHCDCYNHCNSKSHHMICCADAWRMSFETNLGSTVSRIESLFQQTTSDTHHSLGQLSYSKYLNLRPDQAVNSASYPPWGCVIYKYRITKLSLSSEELNQLHDFKCWSEKKSWEWKIIRINRTWHLNKMHSTQAIQSLLSVLFLCVNKSSKNSYIMFICVQAAV